jgi:hypothetical protein
VTPPLGLHAAANSAAHSMTVIAPDLVNNFIRMLPSTSY